MKHFGPLVFLLITFNLLTSSQKITAPRHEIAGIALGKTTTKLEYNVVPLINVIDLIFFFPICHQ
jgi:biopolymer transport protein ExbD